MELGMESRSFKNNNIQDGIANNSYLAMESVQALCLTSASW